MWNLNTKGIPLNAVVFINGGTVQLSVPQMAEFTATSPEYQLICTKVLAVREDSSRDALALGTVSQPHKGPFVLVHMTVNTAVVVSWA